MKKILSKTIFNGMGLRDEVRFLNSGAGVWCIEYNTLFDVPYDTVNKVSISAQKGRDDHILINLMPYEQVNTLLEVNPLKFYTNNGFIYFCNDKNDDPNLFDFEFTIEFETI